MSDATIRNRPRDRDAVMNSLRAGVVPRSGQHLIQVGRVRELETLVSDLDRISDGASTFRIVIGECGAGKTFFLNLVRGVALENKMVVASAELSTDRRFHASNGHARSLYAELKRSLSTRSKSGGGAMVAIVEQFASVCRDQVTEEGGTTEAIVRTKLAPLTDMVNGHDFAAVVTAYVRGAETHNAVLRANAIKWMRGEFTTKNEANAALGVRSIIDDAAVYDQLKLFARFVRLGGYGGLVVQLDELENLCKLTDPQARSANYGTILRILNDALQGAEVGLGVLLGGTPEFLLDTRRGLCSDQALQSRLAPNEFARDELADFTGPVVRLARLTPEDFFVLLQKIRVVSGIGEDSTTGLPDDAIQAFMRHGAERVGDAYFRTPRTTITSFVNLVSVLQQNPGTQWTDLLTKVQVARDTLADTMCNRRTTT